LKQEKFALSKRDLKEVLFSLNRSRDRYIFEEFDLSGFYVTIIKDILEKYGFKRIRNYNKNIEPMDYEIRNFDTGDYDESTNEWRGRFDRPPFTSHICLYLHADKARAKPHRQFIYTYHGSFRYIGDPSVAVPDQNYLDINEYQRDIIDVLFSVFYYNVNILPPDADLMEKHAILIDTLEKDIDEVLEKKPYLRKLLAKVKRYDNFLKKLNDRAKKELDISVKEEYEDPFCKNV
jgi:hypothetical protein